jgi:uncharacterized protein (UPF0335 family)
MAIDQDYALGIGVQLQTSSIAEFERQVKAQLDKIPPVAIKVSASIVDLERLLATGQRISQQLDKVKASASDAGAAISKMSPKEEAAAWADFEKTQSSVTKSLEATTGAVQRLGKQVDETGDQVKGFFSTKTGMGLDAENADLFGVRNLTAQWDKYKSNVEKIASEHRQINQMLNEQSSLPSMQGTMGSFALFGQEDPERIANSVKSQFRDIKAQIDDARASAKMFKDEVSRLGGISQFQQFYGATDDQMKQFISEADQLGQRVKAMPSYWDHVVTSFKNHLGQWTLMTASITAAYTALEQFQHALQETSEFQVQGVLFQANQRSAALQGIPINQVDNTQLLQSATQLAMKWGDTVNDVAQDLSLWYKRTGDLNDAMYLTNQAMEFQLTTGTDLEQIYKTLTALSVQAEGQKLGGVFGNQTFDLSKTRDVLEEIYAAAVAAGGGMRQISAGEKEIGSGSSNAGELLLDAIDKDNAALKMLGSNMTDSIALNAALIQSFGNAGASASEAGEKIGRIAGSLASLSKPGALDVFGKAGFDVKALNDVLDTHKNVLFELLDQYSKMDTQQQMFVSHTIGGTRQFEAVQAVYEAYKGHLQDIQKAMADLSQEDQTAGQMHDTLANSVSRLNAEWESMALLLGGPVINALSALVSGTAQAIAGVLDLGNGVAAVLHMAAAASNPTNLALYVASGESAVDLDHLQGAGINHSGGSHPYKLPAGHFNKKSGRYDYKGHYIDPSTGDVYEGDDTLVPYIDPNLALGRPYLSQAISHPGKRIGNIYDASFQAKIKGPSQSYGYSSDIGEVIGGGKGSGIGTFIGNVADMDSLNTWNQIQDEIRALKSKEQSGKFGGGSGQSSVPDYSQAAMQNRDLAASYTDLLAIKQSLIDQDQESVSHIQALIQTQGNSKKLTDELTQAYNNERQAIQQKDSILSAEMQQFSDRAEQERKMAMSFPKNSKERKGWMALSDDDVSKAAALRTELQRNHDQWLSLADAIAKADHALVEYSAHTDINALETKWKALFGRFRGGSATGSDLVAGQNQIDAALKSRMKTLNPNDPEFQTAARLLDEIDSTVDRVQQKFENLESTLSDGIDNGLFQLAHPGDKPLDKYLQGLMSLEKEFQNYMKIAADAKDPAAAQAQVTQWMQVRQAVLQATLAEDEYTQRARDLRNTPTFAALTAGANSIGNSLIDSIMGGQDQVANNQVEAIQSQITQLEYEKNMLQGSNNELERMQLEQRIKQLQDKAKGIEDQERNPSILKKAFQEAEKAAMTGLVDRLKKDLQDSFVESILGKDPKDITNQQTQNTVNFNLGVTNFGKGIGYFNDGVNALIDLFGGNGSVGHVPGSGGINLGGVGSGMSLSGLSSVGGAGIMSAGAMAAYSGSSSLGTVPGFSNGSYTGGTVPGFANGQYTGSSPASLLATIAGMSAVTPYLGDTSNIGVKSGGGGSGASGTSLSVGKSNASRIMGALGGISTAVSGYDQGGFGGSLMAGLGTYSALSSLAGIQGLSFLGPYALPAAALMFGLSLFHPHYNASQNPDMFADSGYAQGIANAHGVAYTQATGWVNEDPGLKQQLGGMSQLQYLDAWYNAHPGGNGLNQSAKSLWNTIGTITGGGRGLDVRGLHQGNVYVSLDGVDSQVGISGNWQNVLQQIDDATNQLYTLENEDMTGKGTWISVNSYGAGGGGSTSFSPFYTPGLSSSDVDSVMNMPYPALNSNAGITTTVDPGVGSPSGGSGGGSGGGSVGVQPMSFTSNIYLDSTQIGQSVNAFNIQRQTSGWAANY